MKEEIEKVKTFHEIFEIGVGDDYKKALDKDVVKLRFDLLNEENQEYLDAALRGDYVEVADAVGDMLYVVLGTAVQHGLHEKIVEVFNEIHQSNLSKLGPEGQVYYRSDGKAMKGPNYEKPKISKILK